MYYIKATVCMALNLNEIGFRRNNNEFPVNISDGIISLRTKMTENRMVYVY